MINTLCPETRNAIDVVTNPAKYANNPAARADAWQHLKQDQGHGVRFDTLPQVTHAAPPPDNDLCRILSQSSHQPASPPASGAELSQPCIERIHQRARELGFSVPNRGTVA